MRVSPLLPCRAVPGGPGRAAGRQRAARPVCGAPGEPSPVSSVTPTSRSRRDVGHVRTRPPGGGPGPRRPDGRETRRVALQEAAPGARVSAPVDPSTDSRTDVADRVPRGDSGVGTTRFDPSRMRWVISLPVPGSARVPCACLRSGGSPLAHSTSTSGTVFLPRSGQGCDTPERGGRGVPRRPGAR